MNARPTADYLFDSAVETHRMARVCVPVAEVVPGATHVAVVSADELHWRFVNSSQAAARVIHRGRSGMVCAGKPTVIRGQGAAGRTVSTMARLPGALPDTATVEALTTDSSSQRRWSRSSALASVADAQRRHPP